MENKRFYTSDRWIQVVIAGIGAGIAVLAGYYPEWEGLFKAIGTTLGVIGGTGAAIGTIDSIQEKSNLPKEEENSLDLL